MTLDLATLKTGGRYLHGKNGQPVTLGYIGSLPPESPTTSQLWLGIEYDDSTFGKHSGEFQGAPVFQTRIAGAGAFIRYSQGALKRGRTFTEAFQDRYGPLDPSHAPPTADRAQADGAVSLGVSGIVVEAPRMSEVTKRIGKLEKLREISVENEWVDAVGGDESLHAIMRQRLRAVHTLNLSGNLLVGWSDVASVAKNLVNLKTLVLNNSRIASLPVDAQNSIVAHLDGPSNPFSSIEELHLGHADIKGEEVALLGLLFPSVRVMHLNDNRGLRDLGRSRLPFDHLETLSLSGCPISDWTILLEHLASLPRLRTLNVSRTALTSIRDSPHRLHLETLILLETAIPSWTDIDALQNCTGGSLRSLRISLAGMEDVGDEATAAGTDKHTDSTRMTGIAKLDRPMLIAKLSGLTMLNLTPISLTERRDAEEWYVRHVLQLRDKGDTTTWGRYEELRVQHQPTLSVTGQPRPSNALKSKLINIRLFLTVSGEMIDMTILPSAPVALLRKKVSRKVQTESHLTLWTSMVRGEGYDRVAEMQDGQEVGWWLSDGDVVVVEV